jgi:hypothetical protein
MHYITHFYNLKQGRMEWIHISFLVLYLSVLPSGCALSSEKRNSRKCHKDFEIHT